MKYNEFVRGLLCDEPSFDAKGVLLEKSRIDAATHIMAADRSAIIWENNLPDDGCSDQLVGAYAWYVSDSIVASWGDVDDFFSGIYDIKYAEDEW